MYLVESKSHSWVLTYRELKNGQVVPNKGARSVLVTQGVWIIDSISNGRFIIGRSRTVSADVDRQLTLLKAGRHPNSFFQSLYLREPDLRLIEIPADSANHAKQIEATIRASNTTPYCLLN